MCRGAIICTNFVCVLFFNSNPEESFVSDETMELMQIIIIICYCANLAGISIFGESASLRLSSYSTQAITSSTASLEDWKTEYWHSFEFPIKSNRMKTSWIMDWVFNGKTSTLHSTQWTKFINNIYSVVMCPCFVCKYHSQSGVISFLVVRKCDFPLPSNEYRDFWNEWKPVVSEFNYNMKGQSAQRQVMNAFELMSTWW